MSRSELREKIMTILYQNEMYKRSNYEYDIETVIKENISIDNDFVKTIVNGVIEKREELDTIANKYLSDWTIDRLDNLGATILRMSIYEIMYTDTPKIVVINEAIELAKKYSDENVKKMINAVLDKIINE
ncbi:MAG: transcription antitermination factor NusB [Bacilli bacterium]|nr:transcription antitermination factor NusB [Bacilli bacterium]